MTPTHRSKRTRIRPYYRVKSKPASKKWRIWNKKARPGVSGGGVTVLYANSQEATPAANVIPMYDRGLVIFKDRRPILRHDFERRHVVRVEH
jgi:hypothetical protein